MNNSITNVRCTSPLFKFINPPQIVSKEVLNEHIEISENIYAIEDIFKVSLSNEQQLNIFLQDALLNFKNAFFTLPNNKTIEVLDFVIHDNNIKLEIKTKSHGYIIDHDTVYTHRFITIPLNEKINTKTCKEFLKPFIIRDNWVSLTADSLTSEIDFPNN
jgi:hypothetical protein